MEAHWLHEVASGQPRSREERERLLSDATDQYGGKWPVPPAQPLSWYYAQHDAIRARTHEFVRALNDPDRTGRSREDDFTLRWLLHHVLTHEAYHGGQAVLLMLQYGRQAAARE